MTWGDGIDGDELNPLQDYRYIGIYRQLYDSDGETVGRITSNSRSIAGNDGTLDYIFPFDSQATVPDASANRCVVLTVGNNTVAAYAYDTHGNLRQSSTLLQYHRSESGTILPNDAVAASWSGDAGLLLDVHFATAQGPGNIFSYPLR